MPYDEFGEYYEDDDYESDDEGCDCSDCQSAQKQSTELSYQMIALSKKQKGKAERTLIVMKPDAVQRGIVGEVMGRIERNGFVLLSSKMMQMDLSMLERHYNQHIGKDFWHGLVKFFTSGPIMATVWQGEHVCRKTRELIGPTKHPSNCAPGTIRGTFAISFPENVVHGSDDPLAAIREIPIFFSEDEIKEMDALSERLLNV